MFETLMVTFREGLEAFLIVAIILAYLTTTGKNNLKKAVYAGIVIALAISASTGGAIAEMAEDPLFEGGLSIFAGVLVATLTVTMLVKAKNMKQVITDKIDSHADKGGIAAMVGLFLFTVLMIAREGMETALMLGALSAETDGQTMVIGGFLGLVLAAAIGIMWTKGIKFINMKLFMQVTSIFLILFCIQLFSYGFHELTETGVLPIDNFFWHEATEMLEGDEPVGMAITYSLVVVPCAWIAFAYLKAQFSREQTVA